MKKLYLLLSILLGVLFCTSAGAQSLVSIRQWVTGDGVTDDRNGVVTALNAAKNGAFNLLVDCPVFIHVGTNWNKQIYIGSGTTVTFSKAGSFIVDNDAVPEFVMINTTNITFNNLNVQYSGGLDVIGTGGSGGNEPQQIFNVWSSLESWMSSNLHITYGSGTPWSGQDLCATFYIQGTSSNIVFNGANFYVATNATASQFFPFVFACMIGPLSGATITSSTPYTPQYWAIPNHLTFTNITVDGALMVWQGTVQNTTFSHIRSYRYSDLQDTNGQNVGGSGLWFPPPHLFYLNFTTSVDPGLYDTNIQISDVIDYGQRVGTGIRTNTSGNCYSLKLGTVNSSVTGYTTSRPDGFMDVLNATNLVVQNVNATYSSAFLNGTYPAMRWPSSGDTILGYEYMTFNGISITDQAASTTTRAFAGESDSLAGHIIITNTTIHLNKWASSSSPVGATFSGSNNHITMNVDCASGWTSTGDTVAPSAPASLTATPASATQINLTWPASTDNVGVAGYEIYRNGIEAKTSASNAYSDTGLNPNTTYVYTVSASDVAGNISAVSPGASAATWPALTLQNFGSYLQVNWPADPGMVLLQATNLAGPWITNTGAASAVQVTPSGSQLFYQIR